MFCPFVLIPSVTKCIETNMCNGMKWFIKTCATNRKYRYRKRAIIIFHGLFWETNFQKLLRQSFFFNHRLIWSRRDSIITLLCSNQNRVFFLSVFIPWINLLMIFRLTLTSIRRTVLWGDKDLNHQVLMWDELAF